MTVLPNRSVDEIETEAWPRLSGDERRTVESLAGDPAAQDRFLAGMGVAYMRDHPLRTIRDGLLKVFYSFAGWLSPARAWPIQLGFLAVYLPITVLALIGLWRARHAGAPHRLVWLLFASFVVTTGIFWAHTSHRSCLYPFEFIYAAAALRVRTGAYGA
jgi:hypothetical protein